MAKGAGRTAFGPGILSGLRAPAGGDGEPFFVVLDQIDEDPGQPRTNFDADELEQLAETIRLYGVLSPVGVHRIEGGRYRLVYGARRVRAARLAGQTRVPVTVVPANTGGIAVQVIENQARANLANSDLARAVNRMFADGLKVKEIAVLCSLKEYQVAAFRSVDRLPPFLASRLDRSDVRALYDLLRAWEKDGAALEAAMPGPDVALTITEARRVIEAATGRASSSIYLDRPARRERTGDAEPKPRRRGASTGWQTPRFIMEAGDGRRGALVTDRPGEQPGTVLLETDAGRIEVNFAELRPFAVV